LTPVIDAVKRKQKQRSKPCPQKKKKKECEIILYLKKKKKKSVRQNKKNKEKERKRVQKKYFKLAYFEAPLKKRVSFCFFLFFVRFLEDDKWPFVVVVSRIRRSLPFCRASFSWLKKDDLKCWKFRPEERPSFQMICTELEALLREIPGNEAQARGTVFMTEKGTYDHLEKQ
jgi:hypothetical protein